MSAEQFVLQLGPFGGSQPASTGLLVWSAVYVALGGLVAAALFARRDL